METTTTPTAARTEWVSTSDLIRKPSLQVRATMDASQITHYADLYRQAHARLLAEGKPPIEAQREASQALRLVGVTETDDAWLLHDGWHRVEALTQVFGDGAAIPALIEPGSERDALDRAIAANQGHGLRWNNADKARVARLWLEANHERLGLPVVRIAERLALSEGLVRKVRGEIAAEVGYDLTTVQVTRMVNGAPQTYQQAARVSRQALPDDGADELPVRDLTDNGEDEDGDILSDDGPTHLMQAPRSAAAVFGTNGMPGMPRPSAVITETVSGTLVYTIDGEEGEVAIEDLRTAPKAVRNAIMRGLGLTG
jgi:hypothetical protein